METTTITLDQPIKRGDSEITSITLRKPLGGALRGTSTRRLLEMEVDDLYIVLPRISEPPLNRADLANLDPADVLQLGAAVSGFLLTKAAIKAAEQEQSGSQTT
ncbi:MAG TPA: phage tail assembly protein [Rhodocyclaceae bacterium]|nr:phage tail assembly protein [Rhodocyclaceae bacterium]